MSQEENVQVLRELYGAFDRDDRAAVRRRLDPDIEWSPLLGPLLGVGTVRGVDSVIDFLSEVLEVIEGFRVVPEKLIAIDDSRVLVLEVRHGRPHGTDADIRQEAGVIYTLRNRRLLSVESFSNPREALEAAGLSE